tara:strand:+ start:332 stop:1021 length:690 start_codon:yes stop_codon:yes gene_type:complete
MKQLADFKNKHLDEDIYVYASGKSCDFIDNSFFDNKIVIAVNQSYRRLKTNYLVRKEFKLLEKIISNNELTGVIHFVSRGNYGGDNNTNYNFILKKYANSNNIIIYNHDKNIHQLNNLPNGEDKLVVSYSTITTAIHLAAYMGAKNIIIVGHDCGLLNGESNFKGYHTKESLNVAWKKNPQKQYNDWLGKIENQTITLKKLLKDKYGCNVLSLNPFINFNLEGNKFTKN